MAVMVGCVFSAVTAKSGGKSPLAQVFTGSVVLISLQFLTPAFFYIPEAALSAMIICAGQLGSSVLGLGLGLGVVVVGGVVALVVLAV